MALSSVGLIVLGAILFFVAPKIVGLIIKIVGVALLVVGAFLYLFPQQLQIAPQNSFWVLVIAALPVIAGLLLLVVGQGLAKLAVRVAGLLLMISGLVGLGVITL